MFQKIICIFKIKKISGYSLEIDPDCIIISDLVYNESKRIIFMEIIITIPDRPVHVDDVVTCSKMLVDHIYGFSSLSKIRTTI